MSREVSLLDLIVHEIRTPLTVALGSLRQVELADPAGQAALARACRSCERIEQMVADIRDFTRVSSFGASDALAIDLPQAVGRAIVRVQSLREVRIETRGETSGPILGFPGHFEKALAGLLLALARAAGPDDPLSVTSAITDGRVLVTGRRADVEPTSSDDFDAEWCGGVGFALPLARMVIERAGGQVRSTAAPDGRFGAFSVSLVPAPRAPLR